MIGKGLVFAASAVLGFSLSAGAAAPDGVSRRKFVMFGWEFGNATPSNILEVVDSLDGTPVDGIGLYPRIVDRKGRRLRDKMMDQPALEWADLEPWVPVLRELSAHRSMRESMMKTICAPTNRIDWTDDAAWRRISETMRQLTRFSREGGLKGGVRGHFGFDTAFGENDSSSVFAEGVTRGCITVNSGPLKPGRIYIVGFSAKGDIVGGTVYWQRGTGWDFSIPGRSVHLSEPDEKGWRHGLTAVRVPDGVSTFGLQLSVGLAPGERCWYDNVFYCEAE